MPDRFQVSSRATGVRRTLDVWVYDDVEAMRAAARRFFPEHAYLTTGACCQIPGYRFPRPAGPWFGIIRYFRGQLDTETIVHEIAHAAMEIYFADCTSWDSRTRAHFRGDNEAIAYLVGELASRVTQGMRRAGIRTELETP